MTITSLPVEFWADICLRAVTTEQDTRLAPLLEISWKRVILKQFDGLIDLRDQREQERCLFHIRDWLVAALANDVKWLRNLDMSGRVKKLLKFGTIESMTREADRDMERFARSHAMTELDPGEERVEMDLGEGWTLVRMLTPHALDLESGRMGHCIGDGGYDRSLQDQSSSFLSLRDPFGKPHVTISINGLTIGEVSGKANSLPLFKYIKRLAPFFARVQDGDFFRGDNGFVRDTHGHIHEIKSLPEELVVAGDLELCCEEGAEYGLPRVIRAGGHVFVDADSFSGQLDLVEGRDISLVGLTMDRFPEIACSGSLHLDNSTFPGLPDGLSINKRLTLKGASITEFPRGLRVGHVLDVSGVSATVLPPDVRASSIIMTASTIRNLPDQKTFGFICAERSHLSALPTGLKIGTQLDISESRVGAVPEDISVPYLHARRCSLRLPTRFRDVLEADFLASSIDLSGDFECPRRVRFRAAKINLRGKRLIGGDLIDLSAAHYDALPSVLRADIVDLRRFMAAPMPLLDIDLATRCLALSDADLAFGPHVRIFEYVDIGDEWERSRFSPDAAMDYLSRRRDFENLAAAKKHYGAVDVPYNLSDDHSRYPHWKLEH